MVRYHQNVRSSNDRRVVEFIACCPGCKTMETISFVENIMVTTKKFKQVKTMVFHTCGSENPCRLIPVYTGQKFPGYR